jgi:hypothetical protein
LRHWGANKALDLVCGHNGDVIGIGQSPVRSRIDVLGELPLRKLGLLAVEALAAANLLRSEALLLRLLRTIASQLLPVDLPCLLALEPTLLLVRLLTLDRSGLLALKAARLLAGLLMLNRPRLLAFEPASLLANLLPLDALNLRTAELLTLDALNLRTAGLLAFDAHLGRREATAVTASAATAAEDGWCGTAATTAAAARCAAAFTLATATAFSRRRCAPVVGVRVAAATAPTRGLRCSRARDRQCGDARDKKLPGHEKISFRTE